MQVASPLSAATFDSLLTPLWGAEKPKRIALAVSGGPDSMALAFCAARWAARNACTVAAFIVDHALRPESGLEATQVRARLEQNGIPATVLRWDHPPVATRLHILARKARYALLTEACRAGGFTHLLLAHQREDQAETILMRLAKGSGPDGLAGIAPVVLRDGVTLLRPFLTISKAQLVATCEAAQIPFVTDPSNLSEKYARGRLRRVLPLLETEGLTIERLVDLGERARETSEALDHARRAFTESYVQIDRYGVLRGKLEAFRALPRAIAARALMHSLDLMHHEPYPVERAVIQPILTGLLDEAPMPTRTCRGCLVSKNAENFLVMREGAAITETLTLAAGETRLWDQRWKVTLHTGTKPLTVRALGYQPHEKLDALAPRLRRDVPQGRARAALPGLWEGDMLVLLPDFSGKSDGVAATALLSLDQSAP